MWRKDRITAINQHFITAFLDAYVKGDESKRLYLDLPASSNDGKWPAAGMAQDDGSFSSGRDPEGNLFWKGFQRRWALGLEWTAKHAGAN